MMIVLKSKEAAKTHATRNDLERKRVSKYAIHAIVGGGGGRKISESFSHSSPSPVTMKSSHNIMPEMILLFALDTLSIIVLLCTEKDSYWHHHLSDRA